MRIIGLISGLFMGLLSLSTHAATTGTLLLQGTVEEVLAISISPVSGVHNDLNLSQTVTDLKVAEVDEESNANTGYKITITSANIGKLKNGTLDELSYSLKYDGSAVSLSNTPQEAKNVAAGGVYDDTSNVTVSYTGKNAFDMIEGTYTDTLTFTIAAN